LGFRRRKDAGYWMQGAGYLLDFGVCIILADNIVG